MPAKKPDRDHLRREFTNYDRRVDIISAIEVWFTTVTEMVDTVAHFERYPKITHFDSNDATPDFTVLFRDGTGYIGELADISLQNESIESLLAQVGRYDGLTHLPAGGQTVAPVTEIDHLLFVRQADAPAINLRCRTVLGDPEMPHTLQHPLVVLGWSFDPDSSKYAFVRNAQDGNPRPRGHARPSSLETWMGAPMSLDSLSGLARRFAPIKGARRLMNDPIPRIYLAVLLWNDIFPHLSGGEAEIHVEAAELARDCRERWGRVLAKDVRGALDLLAQAKLAEQTEQDGWVVAHRPLTERRDDVVEQILQRIVRPPAGPVTARERAERQQRRRAEAERAADQERLDLP